jgi:hypothetical protein
MASILKVDDLRGNTSAGNITITSEGGSATMQLQSALLKSYCRFNGTDATPSFAKSFNTSSLTDSGAGDFTVAMSNNMGDSSYLFASFDEGGTDVTRYTYVDAFSTSSYGLVSAYNVSTITKADIGRTGTSIVGDLA